MVLRQRSGIARRPNFHPTGNEFVADLQASISERFLALKAGPNIHRAVLGFIALSDEVLEN